MSSIWIYHYKTRYVDDTRRLKSLRSLSCTSAHHTMVTLVNIMVMNWWLRSFSFHVKRPPHSWDKAISDSDLDTPRSRSWVWSKIKVTYCTQYSTNALPFLFTSFEPTISGIWPKYCLTLKKHIRKFSRKMAQITVSNRTSPKSNRVITMARAITQPGVVVIWWVVLTLSRRQANFY